MQQDAQPTLPQQNQTRTRDRNGSWNNQQAYQTYDRRQQQMLQQQRYQQWNNRWGNWQTLERRRYQELQNQRRLRYQNYLQQRYWAQLRRDQLRLQQAQYYDNLINDYRYYRGGNYYYTSSYGAQMIQNAINRGYEEGYYAGQADREDGWGGDYQSSYGYQDASIGYDSYYVELDEYSYYFREGFQRGYEDGYYGQDQYGSYRNGKYEILGTILQTIFSFARF
jgi:hypothetical protein